MKSKIVLAIAFGVVILATLFANRASAQVSSELEDLNSNSEVKRQVSRLQTRSRIAIVQNRSVKRDWRLELGTSYGPVAAGDSYLSTQNLGAQADLHINPHVSIGVRYAKAFNQLTPEGASQYEQARVAKLSGSLDYNHPLVDYPEESVLGVLSWYMLYGKINLFDVRVVQFDIYSLAGAGQMKLSMGSTSTWTAGGGIAFWLNQYVSSRLEMRYQTYADHLETTGRDLNLGVATFGIGVLL